jgi:hypothetical protein
MRYRSISLSAEMHRRLEQLCRRMTTMRPPLPVIAQGAGSAGFRRIESTWLRTLHFRMAEAATAWNASWSSAIEDPHAMHPALVGAGGRPIGDPTLALVARVVAAVMREEILAGTPPPEAEAGSRLDLTITHTHEIPAFPPARESLVLSLTWAVTTAQGLTLWCVDSAREYDLQKLPPEAAEVLTAKPRYETVEEVGVG